jgi:protein required for attachment to host cells
MTKSWIVVADEAIARILARSKNPDELESVEELTDPAAHAREADLNRDAQGRRAGSATHSARPNTPHRLRSTANATASAGESEKHLEAAGFARRVAEHLARARQAQRFDELRIIAAPRFLCELRKALTDDVAGCVKETLDKDLVHMTNDEIAGRLFPRQPQA